MTHTMSPATTLWVHPTRSVRRASGLVLVGHPELGLEQERAGIRVSQPPDRSSTTLRNLVLFRTGSAERRW